MFKYTKAFSSFSVSDLNKAKAFYQDVLGLEVEEDYGGLTIHTAEGNQIMVYPKDNHQPATFTVLNFSVADIQKAVDDLVAQGITFEQYNLPGIKTNEKGISEWEGGGPKMAWFKDPAGNILSLMQEG